MTDNERNLHEARVSLVDWVDQWTNKGVAPPLVIAMILDTAVDLSFYCMGSEKTLEAVDMVVREKIKKFGEENPGNN